MFKAIHCSGIKIKVIFCFDNGFLINQHMENIHRSLFVQVKILADGPEEGGGQTGYLIDSFDFFFYFMLINLERHFVGR